MFLSAKQKVAEILASIQAQGRRVLLEHEAKQLLSAWGIPTTKLQLARSSNDAVRAARALKYPVVMKIASPDILRKSEVMGVKVGLSSEVEVRNAFDELIASARSFRPSARILGVIVQEYIPPAQEVVINCFQDPVFGPIVAFGLGGPWIEVLKDFSLRLAPVSESEAKSMVLETKGGELLRGDGRPPADLGALVNVLQRAGAMLKHFPELAELDLDPLFVFPEGKGAVAVGVQALLKEESPSRKV